MSKKEEGQQPAVIKKSNSERFTAAVMKEYQSSAGEVKLTSFQKKLIQNYFIKLDQTLKDSETKRLKKSEQYRDAVPVTWENVNMNKLALEVVALSSVGLDPLQPNHVNLLPYKNNANQIYDVTPIIGYRGLQLKAFKYGLDSDIPDDVIIELVYKTDNFKSIKKSAKNRIEDYDFEITNDFDRGELIGGFFYFCYLDHPEKNSLRVFNKHQIEKRKPKYASPEFWGGEKDKYVAGKKEGKETIEGWFDEMCWKTVCRAAYNSITIDSQKIDNHLVSVMAMEENQNYSLQQSESEDVAHEVVNDTASIPIDFTKSEEAKSEDKPEEEKEPGF